MSHCWGRLTATYQWCFSLHLMQQHSVSTALPTQWLLPTRWIQHLHAVLHTKNTAGKDTKANALLSWINWLLVMATWSAVHAPCIIPQFHLHKWTFSINHAFLACVISHCKEDVNWSPLQDAITGDRKWFWVLQGGYFCVGHLKFTGNKNKCEVGCLWNMQTNSLFYITSLEVYFWAFSPKTSHGQLLY